MVTRDEGGAWAAPPRVPEDDAGWEAYHSQMFDPDQVRSPFIQWKVDSTGVNIARMLRRVRFRALSSWAAQHGANPADWPLVHPPTVLWFPHSACGACLRCDWLGPHATDEHEAADQSRAHAAEHLRAGAARPPLLKQPLRVWRRDEEFDPTGPEWAG